jgi:hypothetical protein
MNFVSYVRHTEWADIELTLKTRILEVVGSSLGQNIGYTD